MTKTISSNNPKAKSKETNSYRLPQKTKGDFELTSLDIQEAFDKNNPQVVRQ